MGQWRDSDPEKTGKFLSSYLGKQVVLNEIWDEESYRGGKVSIFGYEEQKPNPT